MRNSLSIDGFAEGFGQLMSADRLADAVNLIFTVAHEVVTSRRFRGISLRLPELDAALIRIADRVREQLPSEPQPARNCHVSLVTEVYNTGGHRSIINSVSQELNNHIFFTDIFDRIHTGKTKLRGLITDSALSVSTISGDNNLAKIRHVVELLNSISPKKVWLFCHHQDVVAILAALIFDGGKRTVFVHHCDHEPALGSTINFPVHFDFTDELLENCTSIGLQPIPLALFCRTASSRAQSCNQERLILATAGSFNKFQGELDGTSYRDLLKTLLCHPAVERIHHIGEISQASQNEILNHLAAAQAHPDRLVFSGQVPNVSDYALEHGVNCYFSSFPIGGGTVTAEIQSAGIPIIYRDPATAQQLPLVAVESIFASRELKWKKLQDFEYIIPLLINRWQEFSDLAYKKFSESFSREVFALQVKRLDS